MAHVNKFDFTIRPMRKIILLVIFSLPLLVFTTSKANDYSFLDTSKILHVIDGNLSEWNQTKFETDKETQINFSFDHDLTNLYLAMKISSNSTQMKMMMLGMVLYLDKKGKKREGTGILFPIKQVGSQVNFAGGGNGNSSVPSKLNPPPDPKVMRENLAKNMILLKTFGFDDKEDMMQLIDVPGGVIISYDWNDANEMFIEYQVPISYLGKAAELTNKPIGIGWKINGVEVSSGGFQSSSRLTSRPSGGESGGGGRTGSEIPRSSANFQNNDSRFKEQYIWTKYILTH